MKLLVLKERAVNESRVAITPELMAKYKAVGVEVFIESMAGDKSSISNAEYEKAGAKIVQNIDEVLPEIDLIASVQQIEFDISKIKLGAALISVLNPHFQKEKISNLAKSGISVFALDLLPRITRAQNMDILSSQSNLAGYRAVIDSVYEMSKAVPMMMTAAGTVSAAKFMILGAGVAGLQAIATAKRLGGMVCAFDVRPSAKEQVQSLGAKFIEVKSEVPVSDGVYAKEMDEDYKKRQQQLINDTIKSQDVVISTALIPGKKAPILISEEMVKLMKPGSIIVDLAAVNGGNCALTESGKIIEVNGVKIIGYENFPSRVSSDASKLFARNIFNFMELLIDKNTQKLSVNLDDEIIKATLICHQGKNNFAA